MRIAVDISQTAHEKTGVAQYVQQLVVHLAQSDPVNEYVLFFSSLRKQVPSLIRQLPQKHSNITIKKFPFPPTLLTIVWNDFHLFPIEWFIGKVDVFISSDWVQPPTHAKAVTILYDLIIYLYPKETDAKIVAIQKKRLKWVKKECDKIICISESTKKDAETLLGIDPKKLTVVYPGI